MLGSSGGGEAVPKQNKRLDMELNHGPSGQQPDALTTELPHQPLCRGMRKGRHQLTSRGEAANKRERYGWDSDPGTPG